MDCQRSQAFGSRNVVSVRAQGGACRFAKRCNANRLKPHLPWPSTASLNKARNGEKRRNFVQTSKFAFWSIYKSETDARLAARASSTPYGTARGHHTAARGRRHARGPRGQPGEAGQKGKKGKAAGKEEPPPPPPVAEAPSASSSPPSHPLLHFACGTVWEVVSAKPCQLRADFELTSDKAGEVAGGTIVYVLDQRPTPDGATRMSVCPEGQSASIGWLTGITKDGKKNLQQLGRPVCEVIAAKPLAARAAFELTSAKAGEVACKAMIHVLEAKETADGAHRVAYASAGSDSPKGWVTAITKDGTVNLSLVKDVKATLAASAVTSGGVDSPAPTGGAATTSAKGGRVRAQRVARVVVHLRPPLRPPLEPAAAAVVVPHPPRPSSYLQAGCKGPLCPRRPL